jgi:hypothetical protein
MIRGGYSIAPEKGRDDTTNKAPGNIYRQEGGVEPKQVDVGFD